MIHWLAKHGWRLALVVGLTALTGVAVACGDDDDNTSTPTKAGGSATTAATGTAEAAGALKIGGLMSFTGDLGAFGQPIYNGIELAVSEINANGGVNGKPIELIRGDDGTVPAQAVTEAQRMVNIEHVSAIIGPLGSTAALQVGETVTGPGKILTITPSGSAPGVTDANDSDFLFRTTISDAAQGIVLAQLAKDENLNSVCTLYVNNAYGKGLSKAFKAAFQDLGGTVTEVPHEENQTTYATELGQCGSADALAAIAYPASATTFLREAVEGNLFQHYLFVDGTKEPKMFDTLTYAAFDAQRGTAPAGLPTDSEAAFKAAYQAKYGELPPKPYIKEAYDAAYLIALAAQKAKSNDGAKIQAALRDVSNAPGTAISPGPAGWTAAVAALAAGTDINYEGATGPLEMDAKGDPLIGAVEWWHVDGTGAKLVQDKLFKADLKAKTVTEITQ